MSKRFPVSLIDELDHYLEEADSLKYTDHKRMLAAANRARSLARQTGDLYRYAQALTHQAWAYGNLNQYEESLKTSLEVMKLTHSQGYTDIEAKAVGIASMNYCRCGMYAEAVSLYQRQLELGQDLHDPQIQAMALNDWALIKLSQHQLDDAIRMLRQSAELMSATTHNGLDKGSVYHNLALAYIDAGQFDEALLYAQRILSLEMDAPRLMSEACVCMGMVYLRQDRLQAAQAEVAAARQWVDQAQPPIYNDNIEQLAAEVLAYEKRYTEAIAVWERMYTLALERKELDYAVEALQHIKRAYETLDDKGGIIQVYKRLAEDIPRLQQANHDLRADVLRMVFTTDKAALQAELQLNRQKHAILQRLSHEFRTPLSIIQNTVEMVQRYAHHMTPEQEQKRLDTIIGQVKWMTLMLDDILELLNSEEIDSAVLPQDTFSLEELAQRVMLGVERYRLATSRVHTHLQPSASAKAHAAYKALETITVHLVANALKFSKEDVQLILTLENDQLVTKVVDQGIGILPNEREAVFSPLVRGSNLDEVGGTGVGLAIVARLVNQIHGGIEVDSHAGAGTTITVRVPVTPKSPV